MEGAEMQPECVFVFACLAQKAKNYELATRSWERYVLVRPRDPRGHYNLGVCLNALGEANSALNSFETAFGLQPDMADAGANAAGLCIRRGEAERACTLCYLALEGDPDCAPALYNLNTALRMAGRPQEAISFSWQWIRRRTSKKNVPAAIAAVIYQETATSAPACVSSGNSNSNGIGNKPKVPPLGTPDLHGPTSVPKSGAYDSCGAISAVAGYCTTGGGGGQGGASGGAASLTVVCVRWGDKYGPEYVERLASGVGGNLRRRYNFVCFTDDVPALDGMTGVIARPIGARCEGWKGWWHKAFLFSREAALEGRVLYMDLDTVIVGPLDDIADYVGPFAALSVFEMANEHRSEGINSSLMSWNADSAETVGSVYELLLEAYDVVTACVHKLDHWLEMTLPRVETLQRSFPGQLVEYNADCCSSAADSEEKALSRAPPPAYLAPLSSGGTQQNVDELGSNCRSETPADADAVAGEGLLPPNARVVCFPLRPKPHEVHDGWVRRHWWREEGRRSETHATG